MSNQNNLPKEDSLDAFAIAVHLGLAVLGIAAWLSGMLADDYKKMEHVGFAFHRWIGMGSAAFLFLRVILGVVGSRVVRFYQWVPYTRIRLRSVKEDLAGLFRMRLPERSLHQGLAGVVQTFGLVIFAWMALTGSFLFFFMEPGQKTQGLVHEVKELHEVGQLLIPLFLVVHAGAVLAHAMRGRHLWRTMLFISGTIKE